MIAVAITGTAPFAPIESIGNRELVASLAASVVAWNDEHSDEIAAGSVAARTS